MIWWGLKFGSFYECFKQTSENRGKIFKFIIKIPKFLIHSKLSRCSKCLEDVIIKKCRQMSQKFSKRSCWTCELLFEFREFSQRHQSLEVKLGGTWWVCGWTWFFLEILKFPETFGIIMGNIHIIRSFFFHKAIFHDFYPSPFVKKNHT